MGVGRTRNFHASMTVSRLGLAIQNKKHSTSIEDIYHMDKESSFALSGFSTSDDTNRDCCRSAFAVEKSVIKSSNIYSI